MNEIFYCKSLNLSAFLISKGLNPKGYNDRGKSLTFYFEKNDQLQKLIDEYNDNIELKEFISAFRDIKNLIKERKSQSNSN